MGRPAKRISPELMQVFMGLHWAGNVRELENLIMRGISFSTGSEIRPVDVGEDLSAVSHGLPAADFDGRSYKDAKQQSLQRFNARFIGRLLAECKGNVSQAARRCGLERQALQQIIRRYGIRADEYRS
jgi:DNA-binding NtrC family response regulator